jgi:hypothetical protein
MTITLDMKELEKKWMEFYINIMMLMSNDPKAAALLEAIKQDSAAYNQKIMEFLEKMEVKA